MSKDVVNIMKALGDETRLRIVHLIDHCGPDLCVCDMVAVLKLPQSTISRQLMRLRHIGLVKDTRDGMWINYSMSDEQDPIRDAVIHGLRECYDLDPTFKSDKALFDQLHAEQKIVRCKRGDRNLPAGAVSQ